MGKDQSCGESLFKCFKGRTALIRKVPRGTLVGKTCEWNCDFRVTIKEMMVKVGETEEGLNILDFLGFQPILDNLDLVQGLGEAFRGQHVSKVFTGSDVELAFVCTLGHMISNLVHVVSSLVHMISGLVDVLSSLADVISENNES